MVFPYFSLPLTPHSSLSEILRNCEFRCRYNEKGFFRTYKRHFYAEQVNNAVFRMSKINYYSIIEKCLH